ncbi:MAG: hypothetical protein Q8L54_12285 [Devosia sp.]|nr:hypothetical protein [Devosia sp.]
MKRLMALVPAVLLVTAAFAQEAPEAAKMDLWCGIAFNIVASDIPSDATEEQKAVVKQYTDGAAMLIERATAAHMGAGYDAAGFATHKAGREAYVTAQVNMTGDQADYSFEECSALLGL